MRKTGVGRTATLGLMRLQRRVRSKGYITWASVIGPQTITAWQGFLTDRGYYAGRIDGNYMASLLSGVPALWLTHDSRTEELTDFLRVPRVDKEEAKDLTVDQLLERIDYSPMFAALSELFDNFNAYLGIHGLPHVKKPTVCS